MDNLIYIAVNGDDVGTKIGQHIAADDHEGLQSTRSALKAAHDMIADWVEQSGGEEVSFSGDEGIYAIPEEALDQIEDLKSQYTEMSGHTLTIGIGNSMSEASKALIYGKLNDKDQIVEYDPTMEEALGTEQQEDIPSEQELQDQADQDMEEEAMGKDPSKHPEEPEHEEEMSPDEEFEHDAAENEADEMDADDVEADEEMEDEGLDGEAAEMDIGVEEDEVDDDGYGEGDSDEAADEEEEEAEIPAEEIEDEESVYNDLSETPDVEMVEMEGEEEGDDQAYDYTDDLTDMVESHISGVDEENVGDEEMEGEEEGDNGALKQDIAQALMAFKENKQMLEEAREQNPQLYEATITMLRSMIDMARQLGMAPMEEMQEIQPEIPEEPSEQPEPAYEGDVIPEKKQ